jgi:hypothetical protein
MEDTPWKNMLKFEAKPTTETDGPLTDLLWRGARDSLKQPVETELQVFLDDYADHRLPDDRKAVVRNGHQLERTFETGNGDVAVCLPKSRDRSGSGIRFHSGLLSPYLRHTCSVEELLSWIYLKGIQSANPGRLWPLCPAKTHPGYRQQRCPGSNNSGAPSTMNSVSGISVPITICIGE